MFVPYHVWDFLYASCCCCCRCCCCWWWWCWCWCRCWCCCSCSCSCSCSCCSSSPSSCYSSCSCCCFWRFHACLQHSGLPIRKRRKTWISSLGQFQDKTALCFDLWFEWPGSRLCSTARMETKRQTSNICPNRTAKDSSQKMTCMKHDFVKLSLWWRMMMMMMMIMIMMVMMVMVVISQTNSFTQRCFYTLYT